MKNIFGFFIVVLIVVQGVFAIREITLSEKQMMDGVNAYKAGKYKEAMNYFMEVLIEDSGNKKARKMLKKSAEKLLELEKRRIKKERDEIYKKTQEIIKTRKLLSVSDIFKKAVANYKEKNYLWAYADFQKVKQLSPRYERVDTYLEQISTEMKNTALESVIFDAEKLAYAKGFVAYYEKNDLKEAIDEWERVKALNPKRKEVLSFLETARETLKEQRRLAYEKELEERLSKIFTAGEERFNKKDYITAIREWEKIIETVNKETEFSAMKAQEWRIKAKDRIEAALDALKSLVATTPKPATPVVQPVKPVTPPPKEPEVVINEAASNRYYQEGLVAYAQGRLRDAIRSWDLALRMNPANERARKAKEKAEAELSTGR